MKPPRIDSDCGSCPSILDVQSFGEALDWDLPARKFHLNGLLPEGESVIVKFERGMETQVIALFIGFVTAAGKYFEPLGKGASVQVFYFCGAGNKYADHKTFRRISNRDPWPTSRARATKNLKIYHRNFARQAALHLNSIIDQERFIASIPRGTKVVIFDDISVCLPHHEKNQSGYRHVSWLFEKMNELGTTVLAFVPSKETTAQRGELPIANDAHNVISLTVDTGGPREYGAGFHIMRRKLDDDDLIPTEFQFWYTIMDGEFDFGWECRQKVDRTAAKHIEMTERQMKVDSLRAQGMKQKEIAVLLDVNAATISRDVGRLQESAMALKPGDEGGQN